MVDHLDDVGFDHDNPMWRYYEMKEEERSAPELDGLASYLPEAGKDTSSSNRDLGAYQGGLMRFGAKHNDIYPILADMIRWKLSLPSRYLAESAEPASESRTGLPSEETTCRFHYAGTEFVGKISDGFLTVEGFAERFKSFSAASQAVTKTSRNGWLDWHLKTENSAWLLADDWRKEDA